ncbi:MAG: L-seryl-tRNA(Sec) selenium transferase, partial [Planctomycetota bacterium]
MADGQQALLRAIPAVDELLSETILEPLVGSQGRAVVIAALRESAAETRRAIRSGEFAGRGEDDVRRAVLEGASARLGESARAFYRKAINATGIILHTGLGRAVLGRRALDQIGETLAGYSVLQLDTGTGKRAKRDGRIEELLTKLTGAEEATLVNNNAAATFLALNTIGAGKKIIVSRGQLVEIGGSFRLPDVMAASGATMVEVGTTNRTHPRDYENAITENTAAILRVHPSNYQIEGFSSEVPLETLVEIAHARGVVV